MNEVVNKGATPSLPGAPQRRRTAAETRAQVEKSLNRRNWAERRFRAYGIAAVGLGVTFVFFLFYTIFSQGWSSFRQSYLTLEVFYDPQIIDPSGARNPDELAVADYPAVVRAALRSKFPNVEGRQNLRQLSAMASSAAAHEIQNRITSDPKLIGQRTTLRVLAGADVDLFMKGRIDRTAPESDRTLSDQQIAWADKLVADGALQLGFNTRFFTSGDSREPEQAGVWGAVVGSFYTLLVTLALSFPIAISAAIYLEEFAPKNRWTDIIEVNINNLAAVPSIVFGLLASRCS